MRRLWLAAAVFVCIGVGPASARTPAPAKYGGTLVVGMSNGDPDSLDPTLSRSSSSIEIYLAMCQRLYEYDANQQLAPLLAVALPTISKDKLTYTIELRKGVEFNDGTPFNAQAVVKTLQRQITYFPTTYANFDSVTITGPYTVAVHLKARDSTSTTRINSWILSPARLDKLGANFGADPVCVGPFMFDHRVPGDNVTLIKSSYYYDQKNVYLDKIVYKPASVAAAAVAALKAGDLQALDQVDTTELDGVRQSASLRVVQAYQLGWQGITINIGNKNGAGNLPYASVGTPLASSAKLRLAFEEAIDRNALNRVVFGGLYQPSCTATPPANTAWYEATKVLCTPYDPKGAKKLVAASGFPNPTVHLLARDTSARLRLAEFIQAQEAAVGINVVIDTTDTPGDTARRFSGTFDTDFGGNVVAGPDPNANIAQYVLSSSPNNYSGYSSPRLDLILSNALKATDIKARSTLYHVAQQIIQADRPIIYLYNPVTFAAFSTNVTGVQLTFNGRLIVANARFK